MESIEALQNRIEEAETPKDRAGAEARLNYKRMQQEQDRGDTTTQNYFKGQMDRFLDVYNEKRGFQEVGKAATAAGLSVEVDDIAYLDFEAPEDLQPF